MGSMVILLSLVTAAAFGSGDFLGGLAARRATPAEVVAGSHLVGLAGIVAVTLALGTGFSGADVALGALSGVFGGIGVGLLYRRLAVGPMHVVAPLTAITSAVVPAVGGVALGERLTPMTWAGLVVALAAIGLVSSASPAEHGDGAAPPVSLAAVVESLLAGVGFGLMFIVLDATDPAAAPWPVVGARLTTTIGLLTFLTVAASTGRRSRTLPSDPRTWLLLALTGLLDTMANVGFLYATGRGSLAVVAVLTSLYPIATVLLARLVLAERMTISQRWGFIGALAATGMIAAG